MTEPELNNAEEVDMHTALLYRDRSWQEVENPVRISGDDYDWSEILDKNGWSRMTALGDMDGIGIDLYGRRPGAEACRYRWLAEYNTSSICKTIVIERWQDLIDFLAHVSSTMLAVLLPVDTSYVLEELFEKTPHRVEARKRAHEDWQRSQRERRSKPSEAVIPEAKS